MRFGVGEDRVERHDNAGRAVATLRAVCLCNMLLFVNYRY